MGYYMRYIVSDSRPLSIGDLESALTKVDVNYAIAEGELRHRGEICGEIEINLRGEALCDEELGELEEFVNDSEGDNKRRVIEMLRSAQAIVAVRVLWQARDSESTLQKLDPLWEWLMSNRHGLMQADGEGYYDASGLILEVK